MLLTARTSAILKCNVVFSTPVPEHSRKSVTIEQNSVVPPIPLGRGGHLYRLQARIVGKMNTKGITIFGKLFHYILIEIEFVYFNIF